jgi:hypothetical protein
VIENRILELSILGAPAAFFFGAFFVSRVLARKAKERG